MNTYRTKLCDDYPKEYQEGYIAYQQDIKTFNPYMGQSHSREQLLAWAYGVEDARGPWYRWIGRGLFFHGVPVIATLVIIYIFKSGSGAVGLLKIVLEIWSFLSLNTGALIGALLGFALILAPAYLLWYLALKLGGVKFRLWI